MITSSVSDSIFLYGDASFNRYYFSEFAFEGNTELNFSDTWDITQKDELGLQYEDGSEDVKTLAILM